MIIVNRIMTFMGKKLLNEMQEAWLAANYRERSNAELATELTTMVRRENEKAIAECRAKLEQSMSVSQTQKVLARLDALLKFKGISVPYVIHMAKVLDCGRKKKHYISTTNRKKAERSHWARLMGRVEDVKAPYQWLNAIKRNEIRLARFASPKQYNSFRVTLSTWNNVDGRAKGIRIIPTYDKERLMVRVVATKAY